MQISKKLRMAQGNHLHYWCDGCKTIHGIAYGEGPGPRWTWNGNVDKPTFSPSVLCNGWMGTVCHTFITDGMVRYLDDCTHELKGKTVELPDLPEFHCDVKL